MKYWRRLDRGWQWSMAAGIFLWVGLFLGYGWLRFFHSHAVPTIIVERILDVSGCVLIALVFWVIPLDISAKPLTVDDGNPRRQLGWMRRFAWAPAVMVIAVWVVTVVLPWGLLGFDLPPYAWIRLSLVVPVSVVCWWVSSLITHRFQRSVRLALRCFECGYDLRGNPGAAQCPECGAPITR